MADEAAAGAEPRPVPKAQDVAWLLTLGAFAALLLVNLGHYALWDDEANTAIFAANLWNFHDLLAWDGTNIIAFRDGLELTGIKNRVFPPFQYVWAAPWIGVFGRTAFVARFPFVLAAFGGFVLWAHWLRKARIDWHVQLLYVMAILGNVSLFLYSRQSRYYGLSWALSVAFVYLYVHRAESRRLKVLLALTGMVLMATNYLTYGATMICFGLDYLLFELWKKKDTWAERLLFFASQVGFVAALISVFNPLGRKVTPYVPVSWWGDKMKLFWWNLRDLNACEFFWPPFIVFALVAFFAGRLRDVWLFRAVLALALYAFVASVLSQQPVGWAVVADIRYMAAAIPLCIFIGVRTLSSVSLKGRAGLAAQVVAVVIGAFFFLTTYPHAWFAKLSSSPDPIDHRSTFVEFLGELKNPPRQAYRETAEWLNAHAAPGATVAVHPDYGGYSLMFHAPQLVFMWQFNPDRRAEYPMLPDPHFRFLTVPDYFVSFGPDVNWARGVIPQISAQTGVRYDPEVRLDVAGVDKSRPELFWRTFKTVPMSNPDYEATYISAKSH